MHPFEPTFSNVDKDIDTYLKKYGVRDTLSDGTPVIRGYNEAQRHILDLYYQRQAYDALVTYFMAWNWERGNGKFLMELSDALVNAKDARRLKRLWQSVIAKQKIHFWQLHAFHTIPESIREAKTVVLNTLKQVRDTMLELGDAQEAQRLDDDIHRIEKEERGKALPKPITRAIDEACFWEIIHKTRINDSTAAEQIGLLIAELERYKATEIKKFDTLLQQHMATLYHWDIWAVAYLAQGGCSDDAFEAFRAWLVLQGQAVCKIALKDITQLSAHVPPGQGTQAEALLSATSIAYENRNGKPMRPVKPKTVKIQGRIWEEENLQSRYPELYRHYS